MPATILAASCTNVLCCQRLLSEAFVNDILPLAFADADCIWDRDCIPAFSKYGSQGKHLPLVRSKLSGRFLLMKQVFYSPLCTGETLWSCEQSYVCFYMLLGIFGKTRMSFLYGAVLPMTLLDPAVDALFVEGVIAW